MVVWWLIWTMVCIYILYHWKNLKKKYFGSLVSPRFMLHKVDPSPAIEKHVILVATPKKMPKSVSMDSIDDVSPSQMPCFFYIEGIIMNVCMYVCR